MVDATDKSSLSAAIRNTATRYAAPDDLRQRISAAVAQSAQAAVPVSLAAPRARPTSPWWRLSAALACTIVVSVLATQMVLAPVDHARVDEEVVAAHVRSLLVAHLADVASSDQHTVKPWFAGKLDFSPPVSDFSKQGFPLAGGRLDYIDKHFAAALVYRRHGHVINVFVWPLRAAETATSLSENREGFNLLAWSRSGLQYWTVSDLNVNELQAFSALLRSAGEGV